MRPQSPTFRCRALRVVRSPHRPSCSSAAPPNSFSACGSGPGSTPWLITGYDAIRSLFADGRASVDDRKPGYPHWNEGMRSTVHKRPRSVFTSDANKGMSRYATAEKPPRARGRWRIPGQPGPLQDGRSERGPGFRFGRSGQGG